QVILMSASINCKEFIDYFTLPARKGLNRVCVLRVEGKPYAVKEYYLDDLKGTVGFKLPPLEINEPTISKEMYDVAVSLIRSFDELEMRSNWKEKNWSAKTKRGSVLVFLPGELITSLILIFFRWKVYPLHSSVTLEEQSNVFVASLPGYRKVILSTNIAESSVTVPDVKYGKSSKSCICTKVTISLSSLQRCPLGATILKIKQLDMGSPKALLSTALSPPTERDIERTIRELKELGALRNCVQTDENPDDGEMTSLGKILVDLPVELRLGKLIVLGHAFGCLEECLII
ncbi:TDRD9 helicase, partial [Urocolius indicus]|nr:TDRD9 helicase [Urocolius indicus]